MLKEIKKIVERVVGVDIKKENRNQDYIMGRCLYYYYAKKLTKKSLSNIGAKVKKDHATVWYSLKKYDVYLGHYEIFSEYIHEIEDEIINTVWKDGFIDKDFKFRKVKTDEDSTIVTELHTHIAELKDQVSLLSEKNYELTAKVNKRSDIETLTEGVHPDRLNHFKENQLRSFLLMEKSRVNYSDLIRKKKKEKINYSFPK